MQAAQFRKPRPPRRRVHHTVEFIKEYRRKVSKDKISFIKPDIKNPEKVPVNPGTVLLDDIAFNPK